MNRLVYLFELDSVRNTEAEIEVGQQALFDEIVANGNSVVLTFNQLTDSVAFLRLIADEISYANISALFQLGAIKVSQYGNIKTASRYLQNSIEKCLRDSDTRVEKDRTDSDADQLCGSGDSHRFLFSGLPIRSTDRELLRDIHTALVNSDLSILDNRIARLALRSDGDRTEELTNLRLLSRFVRLVLVISVQKNISNPPRQEKRKTLVDFLHKLYDMPSAFYADTNGSLEKKACRVFSTAIQLLQETEARINRKSGERINNRSVWIRELPREDKTCSAMAEMIVDLCYNFTVEESIRNVSKHYLDAGDQTLFYEHFLSHLAEYWNMFEEKKHTLFSTTENAPEFKTSSLPWEIAVGVWTRPQRSVLRRMKSFGKNEKNNTQEMYISLYEYNYENEKVAWERANFRKFLTILLTVLFYLLLFCGVNALMNAMQEFVIQIFPKTSFSALAVVLFQMIVIAILLGILGSFLTKLLKLPDILDSILSIGHEFSYLRYTRKKPVLLRSQSRKPPDLSSVAPKDVYLTVGPLSVPENECLLPMTTDWEKYQNLMIYRPNLFVQSEYSNIVTDWEIASRYQAANNKKIGVVYESQYNLLLVDLIALPNGEYTTYERIVPAVQQGAVVIFATCGSKIVLLKQYRHAMRNFAYSCPRGFGEPGINAEENARKETQEELNADVLSCRFLGKTVADSGLSGNDVSVFWCTVGKINTKRGYEGITEAVLLDEKEFKNWIRSGRISDGFTLAAYSLYLLRDRDMNEKAGFHKGGKENDTGDFG